MIRLRVLLMLVLLLPVSAPAETVFLVESYHAEYPWDVSYKEGLAEVLGARVQMESFQLDTKRLAERLHPEQALKAWERYLEHRSDLVILADDNALRLLAPRFLDTTIPVVYLGINRNPRGYGVVGVANFTGVLERPLLRRSVAVLKRLLSPSPRKVLVLFDSGETSRAIEESTFGRGERDGIAGIRTDLARIGTFSEWRKAVLTAKEKGYDGIIVGLYHTLRDATGLHVSDTHVIRWTSSESPVPLFAFWDFAVGAGMTAGGLVLHGKIQGIAAGGIVLQILDGRKPSEIALVTPQKGQYRFSQSELVRWKIRLPEDIRKEAVMVP